LAWISRLWDLPNIKAVVLTAIIGIVIDIVRRVFTPRGRLVWGVSHQEHFILPGQPNQTNVRTRQIIVENSGREVAEDVEVTLNFAPQHWHAFPPLLRIAPPSEDRFLRLTTAMLNKGERFVLSVFDSRIELPLIMAVRWKGGVAKHVRLGPRQIFPRWFERVIVVVLCVGALTIIFLVLRLIFWWFSIDEL
jgi:hypothetical protein